MMTLARNAAHHLRILNDEPQTVYPAALLRDRVLGMLERTAQVDTLFVRRERYQAGAASDEERQRVRQQFLANVRDTDYTVCVRGTGNFSQRLYEVVALGRIPIFVDTDCILPFEHVIDWKTYCVWVDQREIEDLPERVAKFHAGLTPAGFAALQQACRALWEEYLSFSGFFTHFEEHFPPLARAANARYGATS